MRYTICKRFTEIADDEVLAEEMPVLEILTKAEYEKKYQGLVKDRLLMRSMESVSHCKIDVLKEYILGTLCVPEKTGGNLREWTCGLYIDEKKLILVGDKEKLSEIIGRIEKRQIVDMGTTAQSLFEFLEALVADDVDFIDSLESRLEEKEDEMTEDVNEIPRDFETYILATRKELTRWNRYYKQLVGLGESLQDCPNGIIDEEAKSMFRFFSDKSARLQVDTQTLREYTLQLRDMYQSRIDVRQNKVVMFLTMVTTIFMPLTLITGWYGMNFVKMPELHWVHGYGIVIFLAIVIILLEWHVFKKKKWL